MDKQSDQPIYKRVLLKLSGEALSGEQGFGVDPKALDRICHNISELMSLGVEVALVIGGGNLFRGEVLAKQGLDRISSDQIGMMATIMNGLVLRDRFLRAGIPTRVMSSIEVQGVVDGYERSAAAQYLHDKNLVIFVAGIGCPLFSTDSAASLRGIEIEADIILKATKVDGVYSDDPKKNPDAKRFSELTYQEVLEKQLRVMDASAICLCRDFKMPLRIFNMNEPEILKKIMFGADVGTRIEN